MAERNEGEVQQYLATPELVGFTKLIEDLIMQMNAVKLEEVKGIVNQYRERIETLISTTPANEVITAMNNIKQAILNKGGSIVVSNPTWDDIIDAINSIPSEYFTKPKFPEIKTYGIPEAQISWGDNVADAYRTAKEFQEMIDDNGGIHGQERTYKGFYMIEYSPSMIPAKSTKTKTLTFTTTLDKDSTDCNGNGFLIGLKERRFLEFSDYELSQGIVTKQFEFTLDEIPDDGKLFIFFLFEKDEYNAKTPVSNSNYGYFGAGKLLVIGGHPYKFWCPSDVRFDEGIIQLNRTGEQVDTTIPSAIAGSDGKGTDYVGSFICIEDYQHEEEQLTFTGDVYFSNGTSAHYDGSSFIDDYIQTGNTHYEYIAFPNAVRFENFKIEDRYHTILESRYVDGNEVALSSYKLIIDVDGYSLLDASGNFKTFDHPGTDFTIENNVDANAIYLRQARGKLNIHDSGFIDKIHLPELVEHGLAADGATSDGTYIAANDGDLYELELPALEKVTAGGVVNNCDKLHELTLPKLETNNGTIATGCDNLYKLSLPNLKTSTGTIVSGCPKLSNLYIPSKFTNKGTIINGSIGYDGKVTLGIEDNQGTICNSVGNLKELHLPNLVLCGGSISTGSTQLRFITTPNLKTIYTENSNAYYVISGATNVEFLELSELEILYTTRGYNADFVMENCTINAPKLKYVYAGKSYGANLGCISKCKELNIINIEECHVPVVMFSDIKIVRIGTPSVLFGGTDSRGYTIFGKCEYLIHVEFGSNGKMFNISPKLYYWYPTNALRTDSSNLVEDSSICTNNLEQFLYNFREYIVKRLAVMSSKTYIYLHATTKSYILGTDESAYASTWIVHGESDTYLNTLNDELTTRNWGLA